MNNLFKIYQLQTSEADKISSSINEAHQHDFEELVIGVEGQVEHFIDFKTGYWEAPFASFITKGKIHRIVPHSINGKCNIWVMRFKSEFIPETTFQLYSFYHDRATLNLPAGGCFKRLESLCEMMHSEMQSPETDLGVVRHLLSALFTMIESERKKTEDTSVSQSSQNLYFKDFLQLLETHFRQAEGVDFYAEKLGMSSRNLNLICKSILQQSVSEIIETRKLIEAKNLLLSSDKTISEIGFELGFSEKSYFTNVFKKKAGQTPSEFRQEIRKLIA